ncbi:MAG: toxin-antitoxin system YwqK family antitoxin [Bacteroidia bacterium]
MIKHLVLLLFAAGIVAGCSMSTKYNNSLKDRSHKFTVFQNNERAKIETLPVASSLKANETLVYYWFKNDNVHSSTGGYEGKLLSGNYSVYFPNDNLKEKGQFVNGLKNGRWMEWYEIGKLKAVINWRNGLKQGVHETYDADGLIEMQSNYKRGKLHGKTTIYVRGVNKDIRFYDNGIEVIPAPEKQKEKGGEKKSEGKEKENKKKEKSTKEDSEKVKREKTKESKEDKPSEKSKGKNL